MYRCSLVAIANERSLYESTQSVDCADEESSPVDLHSPSESLPCSSPLRVAPSEEANTLISRDNNSSVCDITFPRMYKFNTIISRDNNSSICDIIFPRMYKFI